MESERVSQIHDVKNGITTVHLYTRRLYMNFADQQSFQKQ